MQRTALIFSALLVWHVAMAETAPLSGSITLARTIVSSMVAGKTPAEVLLMANNIALALSEQGLCDKEAVQSMMDAGIPFDNAVTAIVEACNLSGPRLSALTRSLALGMSGGSGGASMDEPISP